MMDVLWLNLLALALLVGLGVLWDCLLEAWDATRRNP